MLHQLLICTVWLLVFTTQSTIAFAQNSGAAGSATANVTEETSSVDAQTARALRIGFTNGIIDFVNDVGRARVQLEWQPLPTDPTLLKAAREDGKPPVTIKIRNEDLGNGEWINKISAEERDLLKEALGVSDLTKPVQSDQKFRQFWVDRGATGRQLLGPSLKASDYFGLLRDHNIITTLLGSNGIAYSFSSESAQVSEDFPRISDKGIKWYITIYKFVVTPEPQEKAYYRFSAKAIVEPFDLLIPKYVRETTKVNIKAGISFKRGKETIGLLDDVRSILMPAAKEITTILDPPRKELISKLGSVNASNELEGFLAFVGGSAQLGDVITKGFLGGTSNASIVSGGIVDFGDDEIIPMVGVNQEVLNLGDVTGGVLFGVGLGSDNPSLFLGPSVQASVLTLSAGGLAVEGEDSTEINFAGLLSVDLSRLIGSKQDVNTIRIDNPEIGGKWYLASNIISKDLALVEWTLKSKKLSDGSFQLIQVCDKDGYAVEPDKQTILNVNIGDENHLNFVPRGIYKYEVAKQLVLKDVSPQAGGVINISAPINPMKNTFPLTEDQLYSVTWELEVKSNTDNTSNFPNTEQDMENGNDKTENFCRKKLLQDTTGSTTPAPNTTAPTTQPPATQN